LNADISGLWPALLMPVDPDGALDTERALAHAHRMLAAGCDGVTLFGTTGEGPAFTLTERKELLERMMGSGIRADQIIVTTTALALGDAIELGRHASRLGVHRQMFMPPFFFNQPRDAGVIEAVSQVIRGIGDDGLKLLLYHFPVMSTYGFSHDAIRTLVQRFPGQVIGCQRQQRRPGAFAALGQSVPGAVHSGRCRTACGPGDASGRLGLHQWAGQCGAAPDVA
jgi:4-hydroxy-tetrahydrodipicolinate synthase